MVTIVVIAAVHIAGCYPLLACSVTENNSLEKCLDYFVKYEHCSKQIVIISGDLLVTIFKLNNLKPNQNNNNKTNKQTVILTKPVDRN